MHGSESDHLSIFLAIGTTQSAKKLSFVLFLLLYRKGGGMDIKPHHDIVYQVSLSVFGQ